jgi:hypothetical protein
VQDVADLAPEEPPAKRRLASRLHRRGHWLSRLASCRSGRLEIVAEPDGAVEIGVDDIVSAVKHSEHIHNATHLDNMPMGVAGSNATAEPKASTPSRS